MARHPFGGGLSDWTFALGDAVTSSADITGPQVLIQGSKHVTFWDSRTGGTQHVSLLDSTGTAVDYITSDPTTGQLPTFEGPDGVAAMWADGGGPRALIVATDVGVVLDAMREDVDDLKAQMVDVYNQLATCLRYVLQNPDGSWPPLPAAVGEASAAWLELYDTGGHPPLGDGSHARSDRDALLGP